MQKEQCNLSEDISIPDVGDFPSRITLELTNRCNLSCTFCPRRFMEKHLGFLETNLAKRLLHEMAQYLPVALVPFFRGEPLLHPDWIDILTTAKEYKTGPIQFTTNGTLLDENAAAAIIDMQLDFISFSLDTVNPELYEQTRRGSDYQQVLHNILSFIELKEKKSSELPAIQVSAVETEVHSTGMEAFVSFWLPKVDRVRVYTEHSINDHPGSITEPLPKFKRRLACHKPFTDMAIYWDGTVALCNHDWTRNTNSHLMSVSHQNIAEVWQSATYMGIRSAHCKGDVRNLKPCDFCDHWKMYYLSEGYLGKTYQRKS